MYGSDTIAPDKAPDAEKKGRSFGCGLFLFIALLYTRHIMMVSITTYS